ncbi:ATP-binding protein [Pseudalkalibacillus caeni]|uniref:Sensor histidine kinase n=1 Tax=Exobacillus caeni TaxID=2574798 RepID=A0A5R9F2F9_9BACL|nr:ATP-binding protein [Pseudalkalibacillus caeni]TLS37271.1 PAS domain S-box protein [Pseudalkalibacillus caeni]
MENNNKHSRFLDQIYEYIQDGIIVMNHDRVILEMNPAAERLTGWALYDRVPYCSFCEKREVKPDEERCYLISRDEVPYFLSEMPTYHGRTIDVEMSTAKMFHDENTGERHYLLVLRDQAIKKKEEEARISKLMIKKLTEAQELEHKRLAQELHDGVGQSLYSISIALDAIEKHVHDQELLTYFHEVRDELDKVMTDVKAYAYQLRPKSLDQLGLIPTIEMLVRSVETKMLNATIDFHTNISRRFDSMIEINLYRIVQEALHNIMKYSSASLVEVTVKRLEQGIYVSIIDNGVGFNRDDNKEGLGIKHMEERVNQLNGKIDIRSSKGKGTSIVILIPQEQVGLHD